MKIAIYWKYLRYLIWLGLMLATAGGVAGSLSGWDAIALGLLISGLVLMGLWFLLLGQGQPGFWSRRSTQAGTNALVATLSVVVILTAINILAVRYSTRLDLTENQIFTLAPETQQVVQDLDQPAKVYVFDVTRNPTDQQLLESYAQQDNQFSYEYVDPNVQPRLAQEFGIKTLGEVYLAVGDDRQLVQRVDQVERLSEPKLTNQLSQIKRDRTAKVYFLTGHGEYDIENVQGGFAQARSSLEEKSYSVEALDLANTKTVPDDADVVVIAGPQQELFPPEVQALENFVNSGKGLLLLADPNTQPGLGNLLDEWGVALDERLILDTSGRGQAVGLGPAAPLITNYGDHPITQAFEEGRSFYPFSRPIETTEKDNVTVTPILMTDAQTQAEVIEQGSNINIDPNQQPQGPLTLGVALSRPAQPVAETAPPEDASAEPALEAPEVTEPAPSPSAIGDSENDGDRRSPSADEPTEPSPSPTPASSPSPETASEPDSTDASAAESNPDQSGEARLVVIGNSSFATDGLFNQQLNGDVFLNAVSWLSQQDDVTLSIRPKTVTNRRIVLPPQQQILLSVLSGLVLPLLGFGTAFGLWWRRR